MALVAFAKVGRYLGIGIASLINSLNPAIVVFGGIMSSAWKFLEPVVISEIMHEHYYGIAKIQKLFWQNMVAMHVVMGGVASIYQATISTTHRRLVINCDSNDQVIIKEVVEFKFQF